LSALELDFRSAAGLVEEVDQLDTLAGAGAEALAVSTLDNAEAHVVQAGLRRRVPANGFGEVKDLEEMRLLTEIRDVNDPIGLGSHEAMVDGGGVGGIVTKPTIALNQNEGDLLPLGEEALRAVRLLHEALGLEVGDDGTDEIVVVRLASLLESDAELVVDDVELHAGDLADGLPGQQTLLVAALKGDNAHLGSLLEVRGVVFVLESLLGGLVESLQIAQIGHVIHVIRVGLAHVLDQHTELRAPITGVIQAGDVMPNHLEDSTRTLTDDGGAQMAHMHLLGDVGGGEINNNVALRVRLVINTLHVEDGVLGQLGEPFRVQFHGDKSLRRDVDVVQQIIRGQARHNQLANILGRAGAHGLAVGLE